MPSSSPFHGTNFTGYSWFRTVWCLFFSETYINSSKNGVCVFMCWGLVGVGWWWWGELGSEQADDTGQLFDSRIHWKEKRLFLVRSFLLLCKSSRSWSALLHPYSYSHIKIKALSILFVTLETSICGFWTNQKIKTFIQTRINDQSEWAGTEVSQFVAAPLDQQLPQSLVSIHNHSELFLDVGVSWGAVDCEPAQRAATTCSTNPDCKPALSGVSDSLQCYDGNILSTDMKTSC